MPPLSFHYTCLPFGIAVALLSLIAPGTVVFLPA